MTLKRKKQIQRLLLCVMVATALAGSFFCYALGSILPHPAHAAMAAAAARMQSCMEAIREYKAQRGIPLDVLLDPHQTGLIGVDTSPITTTTGALASKRTSADPNMAALCVRLLWQAGIREGDRVACCFSGSFPGLNIAVITACEALGAEPVFMVSIGSSTYGANNPELTAPEMLQLLYEEGLIHHSAAGITWGGENDMGDSLLGRLLPDETPVLNRIAERLAQEGLEPTVIADYQENLAWRMERYGRVDCFVNVGGNVTALGQGGRGMDLGWGLLAGQGSLEEEAGLLERYLALGVPVIHLLNLKKLTAAYGLAYDSPALAPIGHVAVYYERAYPKGWILAVFVLLAIESGLYRKPELILFGKAKHRASH